MRTLRGPHGCPWDIEQTLRSLRPYVLEETYELLDALDREDPVALREELGDFLYEAVFLAQISEERGHFAIGDAIQAITDKLVGRHPHVFERVEGAEGHEGAEDPKPMTSADVIEKWEDLKTRERQSAGTPARTILSGVPRTLPALLRAYELGARAASVGFDWVQTADVLDKIDEEVGELKEAVHRALENPLGVEEEVGDLLFSIVNLVRKLGIEPEAALRVANEKFQRRFNGLEREVLASNKSLRELSLDELNALWNAQKLATMDTKTRS